MKDTGYEGSLFPLHFLQEDEFEAIYQVDETDLDLDASECGKHLPWVQAGSQWEALDDVKGGKLELQAVISARRDEMEFIKKKGVYIYSTYAEAMRVSGKPPIGVRWVDTWKVKKSPCAPMCPRI